VTDDTAPAGGRSYPAPPPAVEQADATRKGPLSGLLVADFSRVLAGPYATMLLADLGAEVIKVESPAGDDTRAWIPPEREGVSTYYLAINRNKKSVALDLADPTDVTRAHELSARADIMIENFKPGGLNRFGLDYPSVRARNERVIYCSVSGFGSTGGAHIPGYDLMVQAISGLMSLTGDADGSPYRAGISIFDVMAGMHSLIGILAALHHRDLTGEGQQVEASLLASAMSAMVNQTSAWVAGGVVPHRMGNAHPSVFPYEPIPTGDGDLIVTSGNDTQFRKLCAVLGAPELADDERFASNGDRVANRAILKPMLAELLAGRSALEWFDQLTEVGVPSGPINSVDAGVAFAERVGLKPVVRVGSGDDAVPGVRHPLSFSATPPRYDLPPPTLDQHGDQVRAWLDAPAGPQASPTGPQASRE
jgi:crotonobetainyl-CoA:carnitine CoA-transferase CaiB-like acyl-CoA transferase